MTFARPVIAIAAGVLVAVAPASAAEVAVSRPSADDASSGIALVAAGGDPLRMLTRPRSAFDSGPAWAPDGNRVVFSRTTDWKWSYLFVTRVGGATRRITNGRFDEEPSWSPDGRSIAYTSLPRVVTKGCTAGAIFIVGARGGKPRLIRGTNGATDVSWSPDGRRLAFSQRGRIVTARTDGRGRRDLGRGGAPAWSPDGSRIAFVSGRNLGRDIAVMRSDGSGRRVVVRNDVYDDNPAWSPDGTRIAFDSARGRTHSTYVVNVASGAEHLLVSSATGPAWRPRF